MINFDISIMHTSMYLNINVGYASYAYLQSLGTMMLVIHEDEQYEFPVKIFDE